MADQTESSTVMVTGATGFVAGWLVKELLDHGHTVHAPVRNPDDPRKLSALKEAAANAPGEIRFFKADLLEEGSYDEAAVGCELIFHTASPFFTNVKDPQKQLVDPALQGTANVLGTANRTETVRRVVLTSSCAAIYGDNIDCADKPYGTITEEHWNSSSSLQHNPYQYSKTVAEQKAWDIAGKQDRWQLVVVNPSLVLGPSLNPDPTSESFEIVKQMGDGTMKMGVPDIGFGTIDVRDLAIAHYRAGFTAQASGRNIVSSNNSSLLELADQLRERFGDRYPLPKGTVPKFLVWLVGPFQGLSRRYVTRNVGHVFKADGSKARESLNLEFRTLKQTMEDMFQQMIDRGTLETR